MKKSTEKNLIFVSAKDIANILKVSKSFICRLCRAGKYDYRIVNGNGGKQYEILISSLDEETQSKIRVNFLSLNTTYKVPSNIKPCFTEGSTPLNGISLTDPNEPSFSLLNDNDIEILNTFGLINHKSNENYVIPDSAKRLALSRVDVVAMWRKYRNDKKSKTEADKEFVRLFNNKQYNKFLYEQVGKISLRTIARWAKTLDESNNDWKALVNNYSYGCESQLITSLSDVEKYYLLKFMLHQNNFNLGKAYELITNMLKAKGVKVISSLSAYRRVWQYIVSNHAEMVTFARGGMKAALDEQLPHITKDLTKLNVGDALVGDGHTLDFMVLNPLTNKPCRATLVGFEDEASRDLVGYDIMITENTQVIASALRHAIINLGKIPKIVHLDNGRAFKSKIFTGNIDFESSGLQGLYNSLGIKTTFSKPYNGRAKNIERFFNEFTSSLAKLLPSYIGNNIDNKPASTKRNEKFHKNLQGNFVPTIEETKMIIDEWLNKVYRQRRALNAPDKTIEQYVAEGKGDGVDIDKLDDLMLVSKERNIHKGAIRMFNTWYYSPKLVGLNQQVIAKYDMFDLSYVKIFSLKGKYICRAERQESIHPYAELLGTPKDIADFKQKLKATEMIKKERINTIKTALKGLYQKNGYDLMQVSNARQIEEKQALIEDKKYTIDFAENINILEEQETEKVYEIDANKLGIIEEKQYMI